MVTPTEKAARNLFHSLLIEPSLVHGDLWSVQCCRDKGRPCFECMNGRAYLAALMCRLMLCEY